MRKKLLLLYVVLYVAATALVSADRAVRSADRVQHASARLHVEEQPEQFTRYPRFREAQKKSLPDPELVIAVSLESPDEYGNPFRSPDAETVISHLSDSRPPARSPPCV